MEEDCSQPGLPAREDFVIVAEALNQVSQVSRIGSEWLPTKSLHWYIYQWEEKPRKTTKEVDGQYKRRYGSKEDKSTTSYGSGMGQKIS